MIILGIDPGTADMGWGVVEKTQSPKSKTQNNVRYVDHGVIQTTPDESRGKRLFFLKEEIIRLIKEYGVEEVGAEKIFFNINKKTAISVSQALGAVHIAAAEVDIPVFEYNALEAKLLITGYGRSGKKVVQEEIRKRLGMEKHPTPVHAADALAIAICHIEKNGIKS
jgi:crossover junction endodeoxyribonuclease RuvC